ncbi:tetratricopeptide repeat-containing sensor histidine kinase [Hanstruepera marina]|uniref:tetratricopeptide repeat-containing sensor histidine kinase n=1 Tax=Hanstruepera marina TaxID=2873265 RepID=UPI001CA6BD1C|nr:tetratricopeptide repeat protein [Hanstruepera marina]
MKIAYKALVYQDSMLFNKANNQAYTLSVKLKDTLGIAETYWNKGSYYSEKGILDSSYYHYFQANNFYELIGHKYYSAKMLYNMAFIQSRLRDYVSSQAKLFQVISIYKALNKNLSLYKTYNLLGSIYMDLEDYVSAIDYYTRSIESLLKVKQKGTYKEQSLNNLGLTYQKQKDYEKAIETFSDALKNDDLFDQDVKLYARLMDNLAYTRLLNKDTSGVKFNLLKSLHIRDSLNNFSGIVIAKLHIAEYFLLKKDTVEAINYSREANELANKIMNKRDVLASLLLLSKIDKENSSSYLKEHVLLTKNLEKHERLLRNKFARIRFETDEYIHQAEKLSLQKYIILISSFGIILILSLLYFIRLQKRKNNELRLEKEQQKANEEIFKLMLEQHVKLEEGRLKERYRISEELHDSILGKIFGTRMELGFLDIGGNEETKSKYELLVNGLQNIEGEIRDISHELKNENFLSKTDYISVITTLVKEKSLLGDFKYEINYHESMCWNEASAAIKLNCYRILQEALQNIVKYSNASLVKITLGFDNRILKLIIQDNGAGFNIKKSSKGIGIKNIQSRVKRLNGTFIIESKPNIGAILSIQIPYKVK